MNARHQSIRKLVWQTFSVAIVFRCSLRSVVVRESEKNVSDSDLQFLGRVRQRIAPFQRRCYGPRRRQEFVEAETVGPIDGNLGRKVFPRARERGIPKWSRGHGVHRNRKAVAFEAPVELGSNRKQGQVSRSGSVSGPQNIQPTLKFERPTIIIIIIIIEREGRFWRSHGLGKFPHARPGFFPSPPSERTRQYTRGVATGTLLSTLALGSEEPSISLVVKVQRSTFNRSPYIN